MLDTVACLLIAREPGWPTSDPGGAVRTVTAPCAARPLSGHARRVRRQHIPPRTHGGQIKHKAQRPVVARVRPQARGGGYILTVVASSSTRCSLSSSSSAVSSTVLVSVLSSPSGPVRPSPRARAAATSWRIAARSTSTGDSAFLIVSCSEPTSATISLITGPSHQPQPACRGHLHRYADSPPSP